MELNKTKNVLTHKVSKEEFFCFFLLFLCFLKFMGPPGISRIFQAVAMLNFTPAKIILASKEKLKVSCVVSNIKVFAIVLQRHIQNSVKYLFFFFEKKLYDPFLIDGVQLLQSHYEKAVDVDERLSRP